MKYNVHGFSQWYSYSYRMYTQTYSVSMDIMWQVQEVDYYGQEDTTLKMVGAKMGGVAPPNKV